MYIIRKTDSIHHHHYATTTTTQRGWCIEAFVSIIAPLQSQKLFPGGLCYAYYLCVCFSARATHDTRCFSIGFY